MGDRRCAHTSVTETNVHASQGFKPTFPAHDGIRLLEESVWTGQCTHHATMHPALALNRSKESHLSKLEIGKYGVLVRMVKRSAQLPHALVPEAVLFQFCAQPLLYLHRYYPCLRLPFLFLLKRLQAHRDNTQRAVEPPTSKRQKQLTVEEIK